MTKKFEYTEIAGCIDHTVLTPASTEADIRRAAKEVERYGFCTLCIASRWVPLAVRLLGEGRVCCVVGFPHGDSSSAAKAAEAAWAIEAGAAEIDMVIAIGSAVVGDDRAVEADVHAVVEACGGRPVKAILEISFYEDASRIADLSAVAANAGAAFVKTSTGFGAGGATIEAVETMRASVGDSVGVKASGGIRSASDVIRFIDAGANRIGASSGVAIVSGENAAGVY